MTVAAVERRSRMRRAARPFGQLYRALKDAKRLSTDDDPAITQRVTNDTAITVAFGEQYREQVVAVASPPEGSDDDDLQAFAHDHPKYAKDPLGLTQPPPYPDPKASGEREWLIRCQAAKRRRSWQPTRRPSAIDNAWGRYAWPPRVPGVHYAQNGGIHRRNARGGRRGERLYPAQSRA